MAKPTRRSARLSRRPAANAQSTSHLAHSSQALELLVEREETPQAHPSIDDVLSNPKSPLSDKIAELVKMKTPSTTPHPSIANMRPQTVHQSTTRAPESALKFGFQSPSKAGLINTPSKSTSSRQSIASPNFQFKFASDSHLSAGALELMRNVREEVATIKAQMQAEKDAQDHKDKAAEAPFQNVNASGRKIAQPKGKAGRFSDVHKAQFHKMDSIENHASAYRSRPAFARAPQQSLKRTSEKAGLDEFERPRTAGKGTPGRPPPPFVRSKCSITSLKNANSAPDRDETGSPAKRQRQSVAQDVSHGRLAGQVPQGLTSCSAIPRLVSGGFLLPTKASMGRAVASEKTYGLPRSSSVKSLKSAFEAARCRPSSAGSDRPQFSTSSPTSFKSRPLPQLPQFAGVSVSAPSSVQPEPTKMSSVIPKSVALSSRLPTFSGLKSILRSTARKVSGADKSPTPKRPNTANSAIESSKKVDFTPSVKSRHAVKLAAHSPSPAKRTAAAPEDPADCDTEPEENEAEWEDADSDIEYPTLPSINPEQVPVVHTFSEKAKEHGRRESKEFKSVFLTMGAPNEPIRPSTLTSVNTKLNKTGPLNHANTIVRSPSNPNPSAHSPSTIRRVRPSDVVMMEPLRDVVQTVPHGLPAKKRRHDSAVDDDKYALDDDAKENRRMTMIPQIPGGWDDPALDKDEGEKRGEKRMRIAKLVEPSPNKADPKKPNAARAAAAKNAKERKKGILTTAKLNMLSKPKQRA